MNENQTEYDALFNPQTEVPETGSKTTEEYSPSAAKGKNNVYQAVIRFVPWWKNPKQGSIQEKWTCWLVDPVTERGRFVDCPSSIGQPSPLQDMYWKLKNNDSVILKKKADIFSRRHSYAALVQVIKDDNNQELEGKILVWRFGIKIWEKINAELKPVIGDRHDPFDILNGKAFALIITKVSGFNNYDQSKFVDKVIPFCIPNEEGKLIPIKPTTDKKTVFEFVKDNSPNLENYSYKEWDQELHDYVNHVITAVTGQVSVPGNYASVKNAGAAGGGSVETSLPKSAAGTQITSEDLTTEDLNIGDIGDIGDSELPDLDFPDLPKPEGITGDLDDVLSGL